MYFVNLLSLHAYMLFCQELWKEKKLNIHRWWSQTTTISTMKEKNDDYNLLFDQAEQDSFHRSLFVKRK